MKIDDIDLAVLDRSKLRDPMEELEFADDEDLQEFKELSDIIDETIIEEVEHMGNEITNGEILASTISTRTRLTKLDESILDNKREIREDLQEVKDNQIKAIKSFSRVWKLLLITFIIASLNGYFLCLFQHKNIAPFMAEILKEIAKKELKVNTVTD